MDMVYINCYGYIGSSSLFHSSTEEIILKRFFSNY